MNTIVPVVMFFVFDQCGMYTLEGYLTKNSLIIDKGSHSEVTIDMNELKTKYKTFVDTNVRASVEILKKCAFKCTGKLIRVHEALEPDQVPYQGSKLRRSLAFKPITVRSCLNVQ